MLYNRSSSRGRGVHHRPILKSDRCLWFNSRVGAAMETQHGNAREYYRENSWRKEIRRQKGKKSIWIAYLLWLIGGLIGLHLIYLRRDRQAFIWMCTLGGYLGFGAIRDFFRIPEYVKDVNEDDGYIAELTARMRGRKQPPFSVLRFVGEILVGNSWTYLLAAAVPQEEIYGYSIVPLIHLAPLGSAVAVWMIGNIGREKGDLKWALLGSLLVVPTSIFHQPLTNLGAVLSAVLLNWKGREWRREPYTRTPICKRLATFAVCGLLFSSLWLSYLYFNATVTDKHGERIKLRHAAKNFMNSPMFLEFKKNMKAIYDDANENGWGNAWSNFVDSLDPFGEKHALKVLGLRKGASQEEITSAYRKLAKEWHPDRHKNEEKESASEEFIKIKEAYEKLSTIKKERAWKNKRSEEL
ncbi:dnaJ homolog subfamily C member 22-like [Penaeus monodon]|uniref:dnaJ homolog subfamily C member 22-like n=1 Tax=Penaeus monodon TaxID=6687 RepID=UPI0018A6EA78|nr:dnaJ homolog subfamily C member 22-like [Penaeus monodon]